MITQNFLADSFRIIAQRSAYGGRSRPNNPARRTPMFIHVRRKSPIGRRDFDTLAANATIPVAASAPV
jgi:hypothetical protein